MGNSRPNDVIIGKDEGKMIRAEGPHKLVGVETRTRGPGGVRRLIELYKEGMDG